MRECPTAAQVLEAMLAIERSGSTGPDEEAIVHSHVEVLEELFPDRKFLLRLLDIIGENIVLVYANGRILDERKNRIEVTADAIRAQGPPDVRIGSAVEVLDTYMPALHGSLQGFDVAMIEQDHLIGILGVEYSDDAPISSEERALIGQVVLLLTRAMSRTRFVRESLYLRDYLTQLLENANVPIVVLDDLQLVRLANRTMLTLLGRERDELIGRSFAGLVDIRERDTVDSLIRDAMAGHSVAEHEVSLLHDPTGIAPVSLNIAAIMSSEGEAEGAIVIGRDLSEVHRLQEQVLQAEKLATLGRLAAGVVHELNNPLTSIKTYGEHLMQKSVEGGDADTAQKLQRIVNATDRIMRFTRDLVTYARPSTEEPERLRINEVIDQATLFCEHVITGVGATVIRDYGTASPIVYGVKRQLHQVFINLITNACHAMPDGAGRLVLSTRSSDPVEITIKDNGKGIADEDVNRVFEPFYTTKGEGKGTGLGLSIVHNILLRHRGEISVTSTLGDGTTFTILLPAG